MKRTATATWQGTGGTLTTQSKTLNATPYSYSSRFEEGAGTNPEELIAAAHAGCFTMKLGFVLVSAGFKAEWLETACTVTLENGAIIGSHLVLKAKVPGIDRAAFHKCAEEAKAECPVSKALITHITLEAVLV